MQAYQFLANINDLYKPPLNQAQQKFYGEFLANFTEKQIEELWHITMTTHPNVSPPAIGKLGEYAKGVSKLVVVTEKQQIEKERKSLTEKDILSTKMGKIALKQGWGNSYILHCQSHGYPDESKLIDFQRAQHKAEEGYKQLESIQHEGGMLNMAGCLMNLRNSMRQKERDLREEYRSTWDVNNKLRA